eukprot:g29244.t1
MNQEIHALLKTRHAAFKSGDPDQHRKSRYDLCKAIREAKKQYQTKLEAQTYQTDSRYLWQSLSNITGYKVKQCKIADNDTSLPNTFNAFYAWFEQNTNGTEVEHAPIYINGIEVMRVKSIRFLRVTITKDLSWTFQVNATVKKAQQHLFFLRWLMKFGMSIRSLTNFYRCTIESILSGC